LRNLFSTTTAAIDSESEDAREPILCQSGGSGLPSNRTHKESATRYGMFKKQGSIGNLTKSFKDLLSPQQCSASPGKLAVRMQAQQFKPPLSAKGHSRAALDGSKAKSCRALFLSPNGNRMKYANLDAAVRNEVGLGRGAILAPDLDGSSDMEHEFDHSEVDQE
jgi:hypothetical protein